MGVKEKGKGRGEGGRGKYPPNPLVNARTYNCIDNMVVPCSLITTSTARFAYIHLLDMDLQLKDCWDSEMRLVHYQLPRVAHNLICSAKVFTQWSTITFALHIMLWATHHSYNGWG